ncbi:MAG: HD domain-containing protein [Planctomycetota bacterium]
MNDPLAFVRDRAPWLVDPSLGTCVVGSAALAVACREAGVPGPAPQDLDLSWLPEPDRGRALLEEHRVFVPTTEGNVDRGTLALRLDGRRVEITTLLAGEPRLPLGQRIARDLAERDMTIGAVAVEVATGRIHDPHEGLADWQARRIVAVGDPAQRIAVHPIRWLRYYRKAHQLGFTLDNRIRAIGADPRQLRLLPVEAVALELRAILLQCASPGRCLHELHECGVLASLAPELARQFDGRPAGPQRWHPEVSQALHLILALEWAAAHTADLDERDRFAVLLAVLCHDLGKGYTRPEDLPGHPGHDDEGVRHVQRLLDRWPGFADARARMLSEHVCKLHQLVRRLHELRAGTLARVYEQWFRPRDYPLELFAIAVAADSAGRLGRAGDGEAVRVRLRSELSSLREVAGAVDAAAVRTRHPDDLEAFRAALHEERAKAIAAHRGEIIGPAT